MKKTIKKEDLKNIKGGPSTGDHYEPKKPPRHDY